MALLHRPETDIDLVFPCGVRVQKSKVGLGVFSFAFIPKENAIGRVHGKIFDDPNYSSDYCVDAGGNMSLEPIAPFCYLNHSCEPNCAFVHYVPEDELDGTEIVGALSDYEEYDEECIFGEGAADEKDESATEEQTDDDVEIDEMYYELYDKKDGDIEREIAIYVESTRDILPGEELTVDYSWPASRAIRCLCGAAKCRGWIVDPAELSEIPNYAEATR